MHGSERSKTSNFVRAKAGFHANFDNLAAARCEFCFAVISLAGFACDSSCPRKKHKKSERARGPLFLARRLHQQPAAIDGDDLAGNEIRCG